MEGLHIKPPQIDPEVELGSGTTSGRRSPLPSIAPYEYAFSHQPDGGQGHIWHTPLPNAQPHNLIVICAQMQTPGQPGSEYGPDFIARRLVLDGLEDPRQTIILPASLFMSSGAGVASPAASPGLSYPPNEDRPWRRGQKELYCNLLRIPQDVRPLVLSGNGGVVLASVGAQLVHYGDKLRVLYMRGPAHAPEGPNLPPAHKAGAGQPSQVSDPSGAQPHPHLSHPTPYALAALMRRRRGVSLMEEDAPSENVSRQQGPDRAVPPVLSADHLLLVDPLTGCDCPGPDTHPRGKGPVEAVVSALVMMGSQARRHPEAVWHVVLDLACVCSAEMPCAIRSNQHDESPPVAGVHGRPTQQTNAGGMGHTTPVQYAMKGQVQAGHSSSGSPLRHMQSSRPAKDQANKSPAQQQPQSKEQGLVPDGFTVQEVLQILSAIPGPVVAFDVFGLNPKGVDNGSHELIRSSIDAIMPMMRWYTGLAALQEAAATPLPPAPNMAAGDLAACDFVPEMDMDLVESGRLTTDAGSDGSNPGHRSGWSTRSTPHLIPLPVSVHDRTPGKEFNLHVSSYGRRPGSHGALSWSAHDRTGSLSVDGSEAVYSPTLALERGGHRDHPEGRGFSCGAGRQRSLSRERLHASAGMGGHSVSVLVPVPVPMSSAGMAALSVATGHKLNQQQIQEALAAEQASILQEEEKEQREEKDSDGNKASPPLGQ